MRAPQAVADHDDAMTRLFFLLGEDAAERGSHAEHGEEAGGRSDALHLFGLLRRGDVIRAVLPDAERRKAPRLALPVFINGMRDDERPIAVIRVGLPQHHELVRPRIWQRSKQQRVDNAENGCAGADADGEREDDSR